jgi:hypothetical protein
MSVCKWESDEETGRESGNGMGDGEIEIMGE